MATNSGFVSPICKHKISDDSYDESGIATCGCGYRFSKATVNEYVEAEADAMAINREYQSALTRLEELRRRLIAESVVNGAASSSAKSFTASKVASTSVATKAPRPEKPAKPSRPSRPKRAPLSPRTLLFIVGGSLVLIAFSVFFATTWKDIPPVGQAAVVLFAVFLAGFGAIKARDRIRNLANFLSTLSSALLMLGLYAAGLLGMLPAETIDVSKSLYLPASFAVVGILSQLAGRRFKIAGWLSMGPIGLALASGLASLGFLSAQLANTGSAEFGWLMLTLSAGGILVAISGRYSKLEIPDIKKPTETEQFLIADIEGEIRRDRMVVRLAYLATLSQLTLVLLLGIVEALKLGSLDSWGLVALGVFWLGAATGLERIGGKFTESGKVNGKVLTGSWVMAFAPFGLATVGWATQLELVNAPNYSSLLISAAVAALIAFSVHFVSEFKKHEHAVSGAYASTWATWASWLILTNQFSLGNDRQIQVFAVLLFLIAATWFCIRAISNPDALQLVSVIPAVTGATIWMFNSHASLEAYENVSAALALNLYLVSMVIASTALAHAALEQRLGKEPSRVTTYLIAFGSVATVLGSLPRASELWQIGGTQFNMLELWPLLGITLLVAVMALASQRNEWIAGHHTLRRLTSIQGITLMAGSFLQVSLAAAISYQQNLGTVLVLVSIANLAIAFVYGIWTKSRVFLYGALSVATVLAVSFDALLMRDLHYYGWQQVWPSTLLIILLAVAILWALNGTGKKPAPASLGGFTAALSLVYFGHVVLAFRAFAVYIPESQFNAWLNTITLLAVGAVGLLASHSTPVKKIAGLDVLAERLGSLSLIAAPIIAMLASSGTSQVYRLAVVSIVATGVAVFKARATGSHNWALGALTLGGVGIWFYVIALITALIPIGLDLTSAAIVGCYVTLGGLAVWNSSYRRLTHDKVSSAESVPLPIIEILALGSAVSWLTGYTGMMYLAMTGHFDWPSAGVLEGNISPELPAVLSMLALVWVLIFARIRSAKNRGFFNGHLMNLAFIAFGYGVISLLLNDGTGNPSRLLLSAVAFIGFAAAVALDGFFSHNRNYLVTGFVSSVLGFWALAAWLLLDQDLVLAQLFNFGAILSFIVTTWLLRRNPAGFNLNSWSVVLPVVSSLSIVIGLTLRGMNPVVNQPKLLWDLEWIIGLALSVAYLFASRHRALKGLDRARNSTMASAALSWLLSAPYVVVLPSPGALEGHWVALAYFGISLLNLFTFARKFASKTALFVGYPIAILFALALRQLLRDLFAVNVNGPELFALGLTIWTFLASWLYLKTFEAPRRTLYSWGIPAGTALLPSAAYLAFNSSQPLSAQSTEDVLRLVLLAIVATGLLVAGMRIGNLGLTAASTTALLVALVPSLYYRIDDIFTSVALRGEMKALLVAVTVYVLLYLLQRTRKIELPSLVAWGLPTVIALSVTLIDALNALQKTTLDTEDWVRFAVLIAVGTAVLVLGAIRKIGGFFYPGLISVLAAAIPYAFKPGGIGLWLILLSLAALIVWVAVRLDRFTGWLKQLR
ncbi:MAG: hypothetical protein ACKORF_06035 [Micrococcales bacterium]